MMGYYDLVLGLIPVTLLGLTGAFLIAGVSLISAVSLAALAPMMLIGHAMFVRGPVAESGSMAVEQPTESPSFAD
ncbi:MAG: hypothetical protein ABEH65_01770 [Halobacteriales archaeon]